MKKNINLFALLVLCTQCAIAQNVGIGTATPTHPLTVVSSGDGIVSQAGTVEVGTYVNASSAYLQTYSNHPLYFSTYNGSAQMSLLTNGNFGIGNANPAYKLDVAGTARITSTVTTGSDVNVAGDITVDNGNGIVRAVNSTQLKCYMRNAGFAITLGPYGSFDSNIGFTTGLFASPPHVFVGDVVGNTQTGDFQKLVLSVFNTTVNNCLVRLYNSSNATITVDAVWSILCIGN